MERSASNLINVIFDPAGGACDTRTREARTGEPYGALPDARREGFDFGGWYTRRGGKGLAVDPGTLVTSDEDVTLYAHFTRTPRKNKKRSSFRTQRRVLIALAAVVVALLIALPLVNYLVSIIPFVDEADGAKYYAKQENGVYALYDAQGERLPVNQSGYYLAASGTQLSVNGETGAVSVYAVVDTQGLELVGAASRIMMFAQIRQSDVARIEVVNAHGSYAFYTDKNGSVQLEGYEPDKGYLVSYDKEKYAALCVAAGYPLTLRKLDTEQVLSRGYAEYGLESQTRVDENGNEYAYEPARYTITSKSGVSHTVLVGDAIVSQSGYYVKLAGEDNRAVYIMSATNYDTSLLAPVEQMITPMVVYPAASNTYFDVRDFLLLRATDESESARVEVAFDYIDLAERENTMFSTNPYLPSDVYRYSDYRLNSNVLSSVLESLASLNITAVHQLGLTQEVLSEYGLDNPRFVLSYLLRVDTDGNGTADSSVENMLLIGDLRENGTYLVASPLCDVVAEVTRASLFFLENDALDWVSERVVWFNLAFVRSMSIQSPTYSASLTFDNTKTDQSSGIASTDITFRINGKTPDYIVYKTATSSGKVTEETPVYNLRQFYKGLLALSIAGSTDEGFFALSEQDMAELRALDDSECQLVLTIDAEDMAATYNAAHYDQNNKRTLTYRFYRYSEGKSYLTINGEGEFFVDASYVEKIIADARRLEQGILIDATSKS